MSSMRIFFPFSYFVFWIIPFAGVISVYLIDNNKLPIALTLRDVIKVCLRHRREFLFLNVSCVQQARCCKITFLSLCLNNFLMDCENIQSFNTSASSAIIMYWILTFYKVFHRCSIFYQIEITLAMRNIKQDWSNSSFNICIDFH